MRPILVGHSQGGIQAVKILLRARRARSEPTAPFNPLTGRYESRTTIVDPLTGRERPVVGLSRVLRVGGRRRRARAALPIQWSMSDLMRTIPDTVDEFTGFSDRARFLRIGPSGTEGAEDLPARRQAPRAQRDAAGRVFHVFVPVTAQLAEDPAMRDWINAYVPDNEAARHRCRSPDRATCSWAADVWHSIKRHWALEAQRLVRAKRAMQGRSDADASLRAGGMSTGWYNLPFCARRGVATGRRPSAADPATQ